jgi:Putative addiction module component
MRFSLDELKTTLSALPIPDRAEVARYLLRTLEQPEEGATAEWCALAEERMDGVRAGKVEGVPAEQVWQPAEE